MILKKCLIHFFSIKLQFQFTPGWHCFQTPLKSKLHFSVLKTLYFLQTGKNKELESRRKKRCRTKELLFSCFCIRPGFPPHWRKTNKTFGPLFFNNGREICRMDGWEGGPAHARSQTNNNCVHLRTDREMTDRTLPLRTELWRPC